MKHQHGPGSRAEALGPVGLRLRILTSAIGKQWIILPATLAVATSNGVCAIGLLFYVRDVYGASPAVVSLFAAVWTASYAVACIVLRPVSARLLPRFSLMIATGGMALCVGAILLVHSLPAAFIIYALFGLALSFFWPPLMGWLSVGLEQAELASVITRYNLSWSTGTIISPLLGGLLYERNRALPLHVGGVMLGAVVLFIAAASIGLPKIRGDIHRESVQRGTSPDRPDSSSPLRFPARFALFVAYFAFGILANVLPLELRDHLGRSEGFAGLILLIRAAATTLSFLILGRWTAWRFTRWWVIVGQSAALVVVVLFALVTSVVVYAVGAAILGAALGIVYNTGVYYGISGARSRAGRMAIHESILNAGAVIGSVSGGAIYQATSINVTFLAATGVTIAAFVAVIFLLYGPGRRAAPELTQRSI